MPRSQPWPASATSAIGTPERGDAQVARRQVGDVALAAQRVHERRGQRRHDGGERRPRRRARARTPAGRARRRPRPGPRRAGASRAPSSRRSGRCTARRGSRAPSPRARGPRAAACRDGRRSRCRPAGTAARRPARRGRAARGAGSRRRRGSGARRPLYDPTMVRVLALLAAASLAACGAAGDPLDEACMSRPGRHRARAGPRAAARDPALGDAAVAVRGQRAQRRRPAERRRRAHARGRPPLRAGAGGRRRTPRCAWATSSARRGAARSARRASTPSCSATSSARPRCSTAPAPASPPRWPTGSAPGRRRDEAAPLPPPRRRARGLPRDGHRPGPRAPALRAAQPPRVRADRRAAGRSLPRDPPRPAAARRLRGPPAPPLHAGLAGRGHRRLLHGDRGAAPARRRPRPGRADPPARARAAAPSRRGGSCSCPTRCTARRRARSGAPRRAWGPCRASAAR